jgi:hypothetical protein
MASGENDGINRGQCNCFAPQAGESLAGNCSGDRAKAIGVKRVASASGVRPVVSARLVFRAKRLMRYALWGHGPRAAAADWSPKRSVMNCTHMSMRTQHLVVSVGRPTTGCGWRPAGGPSPQAAGRCQPWFAAQPTATRRNRTQANEPPAVVRCATHSHPTQAICHTPKEEAEAGASR